jgi:hypothetical protein
MKKLEFINRLKLAYNRKISCKNTLSKGTFKKRMNGVVEIGFDK